MEVQELEVGMFYCFVWFGLNKCILHLFQDLQNLSSQI